jgi:hypothetical protein
MHPKDVREDDYIASGLHEPMYDYIDYTKHCGYAASVRSGSTSTTSCVVATHLLAASSLHQPCHAP